MANPFVAEIRIFAGNFAPRSWALCNGQLLSISQNTALFSLLGTTYGGNGTSNFALPNLQGMAPLGRGQGSGLSDRLLGETAGVPAVTLLVSEIAQHSHAVTAVDGAGSTTGVVNATWAKATEGRRAENLYSAPGTSPPSMNFSALSVTGGNLPHNNMPPYLTLNFIIALQGVYPSRA
ncbi:MAG TPA: tail fiber protein [Acidimicrobiales bacterium]|jgi:microcystin-dependent protein|nr:tail fiber protein [Acidimicrobiales bacterium]